MVSSTIIETLASPQTALKTLYKQAIDAGKEDELPEVVASHFSSIFARDRDIDLVSK